MDKRLIALATWAVIAVSGFAIRIDYMLSLSVRDYRGVIQRHPFMV